MVTYAGERLGSHWLVHVDGKPLCPRLDLHPYRAEGFRWGDRSGGAAQLALAMLADHLPSDENRALAHTQAFKDQVIARLVGDRWTLTSREVENVLAVIEASHRVAA